MKQLLGSTDSLQLFPLTYPWAWDMYLKNMDNHWTLREIPVANDVALWRSDRLSEKERRLFLSIMAQLTTFDVQRGDETAESLLGIIDPPEIKHYLKRLADEEALQTWGQASHYRATHKWVYHANCSHQRGPHFPPTLCGPSHTHAAVSSLNCRGTQTHWPARLPAKLTRKCGSERKGQTDTTH